MHFANDYPRRRQRHRKPAPPVPRLGVVHRQTTWLWVICTAYGHRVAMVFVAAVVCLGANLSSDMMWRSCRCTQCGTRGAIIHHLSHNNSVIGTQPFPLNDIGGPRERHQ